MLCAIANTTPLLLFSETFENILNNHLKMCEINFSTFGTFTKLLTQDLEELCGSKFGLEHEGRAAAIADAAVEAGEVVAYHSFHA